MNGGHVVFDDRLPEVKEEQFKDVDWKHIYGMSRKTYQLICQKLKEIQ